MELWSILSVTTDWETFKRTKLKTDVVYICQQLALLRIVYHVWHITVHTEIRSSHSTLRLRIPTLWTWWLICYWKKNHCKNILKRTISLSFCCFCLCSCVCVPSKVSSIPLYLCVMLMLFFHVAGVIQMIITAMLGFVQMYVTCGMYKTVRRESKPSNFYRNMTVVGSCR